MDDRWVTGDQFSVTIPGDAAALQAGGPRFLNEAFRASGVLVGGNRVSSIGEFRESAGGSTGRKVVLSVHYDEPAGCLPSYS